MTISNRRLAAVAVITVVALAGAIAWGGYRYAARNPANVEGIADQKNGNSDPGPPTASQVTTTFNAVPDSLSDADRRYIWDIEHIALLLDVRIFPRLAKAIRERSEENLGQFFSENFSGRIGRPDHGHTASCALAEFRWLNDKDEWMAADRKSFLEFLLQLSTLFREMPTVEVRLMRLSPVKRHEMDGMWQGTMKYRLAGQLHDGQLCEFDVQGHFTMESPGDDIETKRHWLKSCELKSLRSSKATSHLMKEVAVERGIDPKRFYDNWEHLEQDPFVARGGAFACDFDRDNRLDLLITDEREVVLFQGQSDGSFRDVTSAAGLADQIENRGAPAVFADLDGDGYEDLLVGQQLFQNRRDGTFQDISDQTNLRLPQAFAGFAIADYDLDGRVDIYVVRSSPGPAGRSRVSWVDDESGPGNQLWRNLGRWQFRNLTASHNASAGRRSCFAAVWMDANGDLWPDLAVADEFGSSVLLLNKAGERFDEHPLREPFAGFCMGIAAGDYDNDGWTDVYLANMFSKAGDRIIANLPDDAYSLPVRAKIREFVNGSELLRNQADLTFESVGRQLRVNSVGWAYGPCMADFDNDGWLDICATAGFLSYTRGEPDG